MVLACAALQATARAQGPGDAAADAEARSARLGHAADVVITAVSDGDTATAARADAFGGIAATQDLVMAKIQGDDANFANAKTVSEQMFAPVTNCFVMGIRDIAFLEPTLVEILGAGTPSAASPRQPD